jgi:CheY-like chemotaxis protein
MTLILLVEDDQDTRENLAALLRQGGYDVVTAANGREAHEWLRRSPARPSVILLDLSMPDMDGWHFRWQQVQDAQLAKIPVVILSGEGDVSTVATTLGAAGYFAKPVDPGSLLGALHDAYP